MATEGQRAQSSAREQESHADRAPRVVGPQTNMEAAAIAAAGRSDERKPNIEWPAPIVNDATGALSDTNCLIERLQVTLNNAIDLLDECVVAHTDGLAHSAASDAYCMIRVVHDELGRVMHALDGIETALLRDRRSREAR